MMANRIEFTRRRYQHGATSFSGVQHPAPRAADLRVRQTRTMVICEQQCVDRVRASGCPSNTSFASMRPRQRSRRRLPPSGDFSDFESTWRRTNPRTLPPHLHVRHNGNPKVWMTHANPLFEGYAIDEPNRFGDHDVLPAIGASPIG